MSKMANPSTWWRNVYHFLDAIVDKICQSQVIFKLPEPPDPTAGEGGLQHFDGFDADGVPYYDVPLDAFDFVDALACAQNILEYTFNPRLVAAVSDSIRTTSVHYDPEFSDQDDDDERPAQALPVWLLADGEAPLPPPVLAANLFPVQALLDARADNPGPLTDELLREAYPGIPVEVARTDALQRIMAFLTADARRR